MGAKVGGSVGGKVGGSIGEKVGRKVCGRVGGRLLGKVGTVGDSVGGGVVVLTFGLQCTLCLTLFKIFRSALICGLKSTPVKTSLLSPTISAPDMPKKVLNNRSIRNI